MKAVLISIQPKWCELIASGKKTVEVRKTKPKIDVPFKCYIYCTKDGKNLIKGDISTTIDFVAVNGGKVIGEFVCNEISDIKCVHDYELDYLFKDEDTFNRTCLDILDLTKYLSDCGGYAWHISDLVIYDKPKELIEFYTWKKCNSCRDTGHESTACCFDIDCKVPAVISRPPQSWCYVEERSNR